MKITINKSYINRGNLLFTGLALITVGFIILYGQADFVTLVMDAISVAFIINGISQIISMTISKKKDISSHTTVSQAIFNLALGCGVILLPNISLSILSIMFSLYLLLNGIAKLITIYIYIKNNVYVKFGLILNCMIHFIFGITSILDPLLKLNEILLIISIYLFLFGLDFLKDFINEIMPQRTKNKLKRKVRITLPSFLAASIPHRVLKKVNDYFEVINDEINDKNNNNEEPDLEVFIHVTDSGIGVVGHVDILYNGEILSYGNYDSSSYKLGGVIGRGVLFSCDKEKYIDFCINHAEKTLFTYGLKLNEEQKKNIESSIVEIKSNLREWNPPINKEGDYASMLYKSTGAEFYKFRTGKFKTYFGLNTNCVLLVDTVIGRCGTDILGLSGIITPGTYYDYLKKEFYKRNSIVITRNIYTENIS